ncbi:hypothetical protein GCM10007424_19270 [Flavobacterium suaedae]|uniref:Uncharacterized protein n=1 Tax=Flavobacterium suaedae TaxID=1767027 RepID=A0ABQ1JYB3_9FLAO|nr:hypothetical protein [Flavobacterium suaedae]GGB79254.1 hypothetical protein GCM10007424_19270 [Flavobacterium suaedae]
MRKSNYIPVFSLSVSHSYFADGICRGINFQPCGTTLLLTDRYNFKYRSLPDGFAWYAGTADTLEQFLNSIAKTIGQTYFEFEITVTPNFYNYTTLPENTINEQVYNSNNATDNILNSVSTGESGNCFGKLIINFDDILKVNTTENPASYIIQFEAKKTQWQYYIINRSKVECNNLAITGKENITFQGPDTITTAGGEQAILFTSGDVLIPLKEKPEYSLSLISQPEQTNSKIKSSNKIIYKGLPTPTPDNIGFAKGNKLDSIASPMYVYI